MRRVLPYLLLVAVLAALGIGAATSNGDDKRTSERATPATQHVRAEGNRGARRGHGLMRVIMRQVLASTAQRLGVEPEKLGAAVRKVARGAAARHAAAAGLTADDRRALRACKRARMSRAAGRSRGACDRAAAKAALRKLKAARMPDLAAEKDRLVGELAAELGLEQAKVLEAVRAELVERLAQGVALGLITEKGRGLAIGCFDSPSGCDLKALRAEVRLPFGHHGRKHRMRRHG